VGRAVEAQQAQKLALHGEQPCQPGIGLTGRGGAGRRDVEARAACRQRPPVTGTDRGAALGGVQRGVLEAGKQGGVAAMGMDRLAAYEALMSQ
jgi:hypothetical protein